MPLSLSGWRTVPCLCLLLSLALRTHAVLRCAAQSSVALGVQWDSVDNTDLYYVSLSANPVDPPFALVTAAGNGALGRPLRIILGGGESL